MYKSIRLTQRQLQKSGKDEALESIHSSWNPQYILCVQFSFICSLWTIIKTLYFIKHYLLAQWEEMSTHMGPHRGVLHAYIGRDNRTVYVFLSYFHTAPYMYNEKNIINHTKQTSVSLQLPMESIENNILCLPFPNSINWNVDFDITLCFEH